MSNSNAWGGCGCGERGIDGTFQCGESGGVVFETESVEGCENLNTEPCVNHVRNYDRSNFWRRVDGEAAIQLTICDVWLPWEVQ